jgi:hypothetical protein
MHVQLAGRGRHAVDLTGRSTQAWRGGVLQTLHPESAREYGLIPKPKPPPSSLIDKKNARRYDDCLKYTMVAGKKVRGPPGGASKGGGEGGARARGGGGRRGARVTGWAACRARVRLRACVLALDSADAPFKVPTPAPNPTPQALIQAGLDKETEAFGKLDKTRCGVLVGSGMGGLTVFQDGGWPWGGGVIRGGVNLRVAGRVLRCGCSEGYRAHRAKPGPTTGNCAAEPRAQPPASRVGKPRRPPKLAPLRTPTRIGTGVANLVEKGYKKISPFFIPYAITNMGGALLAIETGFMGPNYSISTACATANYAYVSAANHIRNGEADLMVVGGSEAPIIPVGLGGFVACRALSTRNDEPQKASRWAPLGGGVW